MLTEGRVSRNHSPSRLLRLKFQFPIYNDMPQVIDFERGRVSTGVELKFAFGGHNILSFELLY